MFKLKLYLQGVDPAYDYESEATYEFELLVKERQRTAIENTVWLEELKRREEE